ncbi:MAG TPA: TetR/AcrR family transcriptional regulator [Bacteroidales bacterium]|nr:TetR/AcrR family transcriptional regulator [Bacteroidales bacterium]
MDARQKVINRACELFPVVGIRNVTMDSLASDLGMSKRTIYELFGQKDNLVLAVFEHIIMEENKQLLDIIEQSEHVVEALFKIMERKLEVRVSLSPLFVEDVAKYVDRIQEMFYTENCDLSRYSASFVLLQQGITQGIFRKEINVAIVDNFIYEMMNIIRTSPRIRSMKPKVNDLIVNIFLPYFRGICSSQGLKLMDKYFSSLNVLIEK